MRAWGASLVLACAAAHAGSLQVAPTRIDVPLDGRSTAIQVTNTGSSRTLLHVDLMSWSQEEGSDVYADAKDLILSPPIFWLDPGTAQTVRIARRGRDAVRAQRPYRLFVQEVPVQGTEPQSNLRVLLRIGVPTFLTPPDASAPQLEWHLVCAPDAFVVLNVANVAGRAVRIDELSIRTEGTEHTTHSLYVLSGRTRIVTSALPPGTRNVEVAARFGDDSVRTTVACP